MAGLALVVVARHWGNLRPDGAGAPSHSLRGSGSRRHEAAPGRLLVTALVALPAAVLIVLHWVWSVTDGAHLPLRGRGLVAARPTPWWPTAVFRAVLRNEVSLPAPGHLRSGPGRVERRARAGAAPREDRRP